MGNSVAQPAAPGPGQHRRDGHRPQPPICAETGHQRSPRPGETRQNPPNQALYPNPDMRVLPRDTGWFLYGGFLLNSQDIQSVRPGV